ncbi:MAG TPA: MerR family transcriptional regulator [Anaerolineales bacterium]|nr:MerR family transcriptional regulator [Anaerolineales bacterium]
MDQPKDLLSIGTFANMTRLSIKALRLYAQLGILRPLHIDPQSGYRYYGADQLTSARMIRNMRDMDMPLATIRRVLAVTPVSQAQAELLVRQHLELRSRQLEQIKELARQFTQQLKPEANAMNLEVSVKEIPTQQIVSITRRHTVDGLGKQQEKDIGALFSLAKDYDARTPGAPFGIYHGPVSEKEDGPVETCLAVDGRVENRDNIEVKQLDGGQAACVILRGEQCHYPELLGAYDAAADWIQKNGFEAVQPPREVWYSAPGPDAKWEIVWLFK